MRNYSITTQELQIHAGFFVAGATCKLATNSRVVADSLFRVGAPACAVSPRSFEMSVLVDSSIVRNTEAAPHFRGLHHLVFAVFNQRETFSFDLSRNAMFGVVSPETAQDDRFWNRLLLPIAIGVLGTMIEVVPFHAACLDESGRALMIVGPSGSGKSTLAVALAKRGFSLVADDWTYITLDSGQLRAHGLRAPVKLLPTATDFFPELGRFEPAKSLNGEIAYEVDAAEAFSAQFRLVSEPSQLLFLQRVEEPVCDFSRFSGGEAKRFFETSAERLPAEFASAAAKRSQTIDELTKLDCWLIRTGLPPDATAQAVRRFCDGN